jgi:hypothetical protein
VLPQRILAKKERLTYSDMGHLLMTGALWEDQIVPMQILSRFKEMTSFWDTEATFVEHRTA